MPVGGRPYHPEPMLLRAPSRSPRPDGARAHPRARHRAAAALLGLGVSVTGVACGSGEAPPEPPPIDHLVVVSIDTLRADHLGCYGNTVVQTPHMDALAAEGVRYAAHVSSAPSTLCSHTSLMTGTYPHTHGTPRNGHEVPDDNLMLAEVLSDAGFTTAAVIGAFPLRSKFNFDQGFDIYDDGETTRDGAKVNKLVRRWLSERAGRGADDRFFLFVHYWDAHYPYDPPPPYDRMYRTDDVQLVRTKDELIGIRESIAAGNDESARGEALRGLYMGGVTYVDTHIGALMELLREFQVLDRSLVVLTSDHGEAMDEHWEPWDHGESTYDTSVGTPLVLRLPGGLSGGTVVDEVVSNVDVMPTLLELLRVPVPGVIEGRSFAATALGAGSGEDRGGNVAFAEGTKPHTEEIESEAWKNARKCRAVREGRWKLVYRPTDGLRELFDMEIDPAETNDVSGEHPDVVARLMERLDGWTRSTPTRQAEQDLSAETLKILGDLGYTEGE